MCARYTLTVPQRLRELYPRMRFPAFTPRYNVAPSTPVLSARNLGGDTAEWMTWGPHLINARSETLARRPSFAQALRFRRGIVFADGYYEWQNQSGVRSQPYRIARENGDPFPFAALWEELPLSSDGPAYSCTIVTREARDDIAWLHDRMPVMLDDAGCEAWMSADELHPGNEHGVLAHVIDEPLVVIPVSRAVNKPWRDDDPSLIAPVTPPTQESFF